MEFDPSPVLDNLAFLLAGVVMTIEVSAASIVLALALGLVLGLLRCYGPPLLRPILVFYIDSMRALPVLVVIVWVFFAFPLLLGMPIRPTPAAIMAIAANVAAYVAEIVRAGIESVRGGQTMAGLALGMSRAQLVSRIILPQAIVRMLPAYGNIIIVIIKDSAIASVVAVPEIMRQSATVVGQTYRPFEVYTFALLAFFVILFPVARGIDRIYGRVAHKGRS